MSERTNLPKHRTPAEDLLGRMKAFGDADADWAGGRTWSLVYDAGPEHRDTIRQANNLYLSTNALNPMAFRSLHRMETEVVQMTAGLLHGPEACVGTMTSGGTESIFLAVKMMRDRARHRRPWIRRPNLVAPVTAHPAFDKAGHLLGVRIRHVPVDSDGRVDLMRLRLRIDWNTIGLVGSAPQYAHGAVDPIEGLGRIARHRRLPLHVDACFGGFILPFFEKLGHPVPLWDFRVPGVTSISADVHKYGYAPKGASVILYRDMSYLRHQFFATTDWPGGIYASSTFAGTRPGGCIAAAWASLCALGEEGLLELARQILDGTHRLRTGILEIPGLRVLGSPHGPIVTYASDDVDMYVVADLLAERGWSVDRQQRPPCIHCSVTPANAKQIDAYLADVRACVDHARAHPELSKEGQAAMYGMMAKIPVRGLVKRGVRQVLEGMYGPEPTLPGDEA